MLVKRYSPEMLMLYTLKCAALYRLRFPRAGSIVEINMADGFVVPSSQIGWTGNARRQTHSGMRRHSPETWTQMAQEKESSRALSYQIREQWNRQREARGATLQPVKSLQLGRQHHIKKMVWRDC
jgi:hypothetical protein